MVPDKYYLEFLSQQERVRQFLYDGSLTDTERKTIDDTLSIMSGVVEGIMEAMFNDVISIMVDKIQLDWRSNNQDDFVLSCRTPFVAYKISESRGCFILNKDNWARPEKYYNLDEAMIAALNHLKTGLREMLHVPSCLDKAFCVDNDERNKNHG